MIDYSAVEPVEHWDWTATTSLCRLSSSPVSSGDSSSWSWLLACAPCCSRKEAFSIRPSSTARKRGVWPRGVRQSTKSGPEAGQQDTVRLQPVCVVDGLKMQTFERELQNGLIWLNCCSMERSPTSAVKLRELVSVVDRQILQELLIAWKEVTELSG